MSVIVHLMVMYIWLSMHARRWRRPLNADFALFTAKAARWLATALCSTPVNGSIPSAKLLPNSEERRYSVHIDRGHNHPTSSSTLRMRRRHSGQVAAWSPHRATCRLMQAPQNLQVQVQSK